MQICQRLTHPFWGLIWLDDFDRPSLYQIRQEIGGHVHSSSRPATVSSKSDLHKKHERNQWNHPMYLDPLTMAQKRPGVMLRTSHLFVATQNGSWDRVVPTSHPSGVTRVTLTVLGLGPLPTRKSSRPQASRTGQNSYCMYACVYIHSMYIYICVCVVVVVVVVVIINIYIYIYCICNIYYILYTVYIYIHIYHIYIYTYVYIP